MAYEKLQIARIGGTAGISEQPSLHMAMLLIKASF